MVVRAREIMTRRVVVVSPQTPIAYARSRLGENRFSALPVVDDRHRLVGIVSTLDLLRADAVPAAQRPHTVGAVMTTDPLWMAPHADVTVVAHRMRRYGALRVMPIVERGLLVGVVTRGDLLRPVPRGGPVGRTLHRIGHRGHPPVVWPDEPRPGGSAAEIMTPAPQVVTVSETTSTTHAGALLRAHRFTTLPVVADDGCLVGVISEADLLPDHLSGDRTPPPHTVGGAMTVEVITAAATASLQDLTQLMIGHRLRVIPVVDADDRLLGVISRGDLLRANPPS